MTILNATSTPYDLTNITSGGNILEFVQNVNNLTGQTFMLGMLLAGAIIIFMSMKSVNDDNKDPLIGTSFIMSIISIMFFMMEFISGGILTIIIILFGVMFLYTMLKKDLRR